MKKMLKVALLLSVLASCLLSCSHLFEDDEEFGNSGGGGRTSVDGRYVDSPNDAKLEDVLKDAGIAFVDEADGNKVKIKENASGNRPAGFSFPTPTGVKYVPLNDDGTFKNDDDKNISIPKGTAITSVSKPADGKKLLVYTVSDLNGLTHKVPVYVDSSKDKATWSEIIAAATTKGITIGNEPPASAGYSGGWKAGSNNLNAATEIDPATEIKPIFTKELNYTVNVGKSSGGGAEEDLPVTITYPEPEGLSLKDILTKANATKDSSGKITDAPKNNKPTGKDFAAGWKVTLPDGTVFVISSTQINNGTGKAAGTFPAGTKIEPNWVKNGEGGSTGGGERTLTNLNTRDPQVGDGVTVKVEADGTYTDGKITPKDSVGTAINDGRKVLGYVYDVDTAKKQVKVVAKEVQDARNWARSGKQSASNPFNQDGKNVQIATDGFDAWLKIVATISDASYTNYPAILYAVCYPRQPDDPLIGYPNQAGTLSDKNWIIDSVVNGDGYDNRWYLPAVTELEMIYEASDKLLNWTENSHKNIGDTWLSDKSFWSVNACNDGKAKYVNFGELDNGKPKVTEYNRATGSYYILPVAEFKYEDYNVNH